MSELPHLPPSDKGKQDLDEVDWSSSSEDALHEEFVRLSRALKASFDHPDEGLLVPETPPETRLEAKIQLLLSRLDNPWISPDELRRALSPLGSALEPAELDQTRVTHGFPLAPRLMMQTLMNDSAVTKLKERLHQTLLESRRLAGLRARGLAEGTASYDEALAPLEAAVEGLTAEVDDALSKALRQASQKIEKNREKYAPLHCEWEVLSAEDCFAVAQRAREIGGEDYGDLFEDLWGPFGSVWVEVSIECRIPHGAMDKLRGDYIAKQKARFADKMELGLRQPVASQIAGKQIPGRFLDLVEQAATALFSVLSEEQEGSSVVVYAQVEIDPVAWLEDVMDEVTGEARSLAGKLGGAQYVVERGAKMFRRKQRKKVVKAVGRLGFGTVAIAAFSATVVGPLGLAFGIYKIVKGVIGLVRVVIKERSIELNANLVKLGKSLRKLNENIAGAQQDTQKLMGALLLRGHDGVVEAVDALAEREKEKKNKNLLRLAALRLTDAEVAEFSALSNAKQQRAFLMTVAERLSLATELEVSGPFKTGETLRNGLSILLSIDPTATLLRRFGKGTLTFANNCFVEACEAVVRFRKAIETQRDQATEAFELARQRVDDAKIGADADAEGLAAELGKLAGSTDPASLVEALRGAADSAGVRAVLHGWLAECERQTVSGFEEGIRRILDIESRLMSARRQMEGYRTLLVVFGKRTTLWSNEVNRTSDGPQDYYRFLRIFGGGTLDAISLAEGRDILADLDDVWETIIGIVI